MTKPQRAWMVRAGNNNELADLVEGKKAVAIGWDALPDLSEVGSVDDVKQLYRSGYPEDSPAKVGVNSGQVYRFAHEMQPGDYVLTYRKATREVFIGTGAGPYQFRQGLFPPHYPHVRAVQWIRRVSRDDFSPDARHSLGSLLTVFDMDAHLDEIHRLASGQAPTPPPEQTSTPYHEEVRAIADEMTADLIAKLDPYDFQDLVAAVLRAMGFRAASHAPGMDRGVDIVAHPDAFGFQGPRIKVQVKHRKGSASGPEMREFLGALRQGDNGLYISTGDFTPEARNEAAKSREPVSLFDRDAFIELLLENYEALEPEYKAQVPLTRVWIPTK